MLVEGKAGHSCNSDAELEPTMVRSPKNPCCAQERGKRDGVRVRGHLSPHRLASAYEPLLGIAA